MTTTIPAGMIDHRDVSDLLPCPFCGAAPTLHPVGNNHTTSRKLTVKCSGCRMQLTHAALKHDFHWLRSHIATDWNRRAAAPASPVSTVEDERQPDACPRCDGTGTITVMSDSSPDAHDMDVCCDHCQGSGAAVDAAKYLAAALSGEKYRHMQVWAEYRNFHRSLCARFGYCHDEVHFRRDLVSLEEAIAAKVAAPAAGDARMPNLDIEAAAKTLAECMDYPWWHMPEQGRAAMRQHAQSVIRVGLSAAQRQGDA